MNVDVATLDFTIRGPTRLKLMVTQGPCTGQTYDTTLSCCAYMTVGRTKKSKIYIKDCAISEKHAEIAWDAELGVWTLRDTCSSNGTRLNGAELQPYRVHVLKNGDSVTFGLDTIAIVEVLDQTLGDMNVETLLRAHLESVCQALESTTAAVALDMVRRCDEALDALLAGPEANQSQVVALAS